MITCIKCGKWLSHDWSNLPSICPECAGKLADTKSEQDKVNRAIDIVIERHLGAFRELERIGREVIKEAQDDKS